MGSGGRETEGPRAGRGGRVGGEEEGDTRLLLGSDGKWSHLRAAFNPSSHSAAPQTNSLWVPVKLCSQKQAEFGPWTGFPTLH